MEVIGDFGYADDTGIFGTAEEVKRAEPLFAQVLGDWEERVHPGKTEGLRLCHQPRALTDVRSMGEAAAVRHVGGWVAENGRAFSESQHRQSAVNRKMGQLAKTWSFGRDRGQDRRNIPLSVRLTITKAVVVPTAVFTSRTRAWDSFFILRMERCLAGCLRRCFKLGWEDMKNHHITNEMMRTAAGWPCFKHMIMRASLVWLGHVARMKNGKRPKQMLFGWWKGRGSQSHCWASQAAWLERSLREAGVPVGDWYRMAQDRGLWRRRLSEAFPQRELTQRDKQVLDRWRLGMTLSNNEPRAAWRAVVPDRGQEGYPCWCCDRIFRLGNQRQFHYMEEHAVCDPDLVTTEVFTCDKCVQHFPTVNKRRDHECPMETALERMFQVEHGGPAGGDPPGAAREAEDRHIYTDGSAKEGKAGWACVIYPTPPQYPVQPDWILYGPVVTHAWDPNFLGAEQGTNNTAELTAIGEACLWLLSQGAEVAANGAKVSAWIHYDSEYARDLAVRVATPRTNVALAYKVADLVDQVRAIRPLSFCHVDGHSGDVGNDAADLYANRGREGGVSPQWDRWGEVPQAWQEVQDRDPRMVEVCGRCGRRFADAQARGSHEGKCQVVGVPLAPGRRRCRKCGIELQHRSARIHEDLCRGSQEANTTCLHCQVRIEDFRLLRVHERTCRLWVERRAAAPPPNAPRPAVVPDMRPEQAVAGQCYKCSMMCGRNLSRHTPRCRGSSLANRTCNKCGQVYANWDSCRNHERQCQV